MNHKINVGFISYLNAYPYYFPFEQNFFSFKGNITINYPQILNEKLATGKLDVSLISSMEYAKNFKDYQLIDKIGLSSRGSVISVKLCSKIPIEKLQNKKISLTENSATSQAILKIILAEKKCFNNKFLDFIDFKNTKSFDAYLIIGDEALKPTLTHFNYEYNLAQIWHKLYGIDILFAVAAIRLDSLKEKEVELKNFAKQLSQAADFSLNHQKFYSICRQKFNLPISIEEYLKKLDFSANNKKQQKDFLFKKLYEFNLIDQEVKD